MSKDKAMSSEAGIDKLNEMASAILGQLRELKQAQQPGALTVQVKLPSPWILDYFLHWVGEAFQEEMLGNEGQRLEIQQDGKAITFVRDRQQERP